MKTVLAFITTPETWPDWLALTAVAVMMNALAYMYILAWDAQF